MKSKWGISIGSVLIDSDGGTAGDMSSFKIAGSILTTNLGLGFIFSILNIIYCFIFLTLYLFEF